MEDFMSKDSKLAQTAKILTFHPTGEYYFAKGLKAYNKRELYKAKKYLERAMELEPEEPIIVCQLAITCTEIGDYGYSNNLLENILNILDPYMIECHYFLANNYAHQGMFKEAFLHASTYLEKEEDGEFSEDAEDLLDLITLESDETEESLTLQDGLIGKQEQAREYLESGNFLKAVDVLKETINEYEDYWSAYNNLALAYFYLGRVEEAYSTLEEVLTKSPGNLHALCNLLVFDYYQQKNEEVDKLVNTLEKVRPILIDHRFKLGSTFALIGRHALAYKWLRQLQKEGYEGDGNFYYWLAASGYELGYEDRAEQDWKKVVKLDPDKAGHEPWLEVNAAVNGFEHHLPSILKRLESEFKEERLFAIFLIKNSMKKPSLTKHKLFTDNSRFSKIEKSYRSLILKNNENRAEDAVDFADQTADVLYQHFNPIQFKEAGLFLMWFAVFIEAVKEEQKLTNPTGWAAACEYIWHKHGNVKHSQTEIAEKYSISTATLSKYIKLVQALII